MEIFTDGRDENELTDEELDQVSGGSGETCEESTAEYPKGGQYGRRVPR
ncbi:MAG: bacteriocin [Oscillospiraceae bacterium]|nr:bacteriocin [Oscillospiraceae bacterium]